MSGYTQEQIDELREAIAQGVLRVEYNDKTVVYRSLKEMQEQLDKMERCLGKQRRTVRVKAKFSKGLC